MVMMSAMGCGLTQEDLMETGQRILLLAHALDKNDERYKKFAEGKPGKLKKNFKKKKKKSTFA